MKKELEYSCDNQVQKVFIDSAWTGVWSCRIKDINGNEILRVTGLEQTLVHLAARNMASSLNKVVK